MIDIADVRKAAGEPNPLPGILSDGSVVVSGDFLLSVAAELEAGRAAQRQRETLN